MDNTGAQTIFRGPDDCTECPKSTNSRKLNHAVLIVGYGVEKTSGGDDVKYWKVMNSWGAGWGNDVFFSQIERGINMCQIEGFAMYPKVPKNPGRRHFH